MQSLLELVAQLAGEQPIHRVDLPALHGPLGQRQDRPGSSPAGEPGVGGALTGAVDADHGLIEPPVGQLTRPVPASPQRQHPGEGLADLGLAVGWT